MKLQEAYARLHIDLVRLADHADKSPTMSVTLSKGDTTRLLNQLRILREAIERRIQRDR